MRHAMAHWESIKGITYCIDMEGRRFKVKQSPEIPYTFDSEGIVDSVGKSKGDDVEDEGEETEPGRAQYSLDGEEWFDDPMMAFLSSL